MAQGRKRKAPEDRVRRNKERICEVEAPDVPLGPELPPVDPLGAAWSTAVRARYEVWRQLPQAQQFTASDWLRLADIALLWSRFEQLDPSETRLLIQLLSEVRLQEERLGATVADRQRLRIDVATPAAATVEQSTGESAAERRARLKVV